MQNSDIADKYDIAVENAFSALGDLREDPEEAWSITRNTILTTAAANVPVKRAVCRPWRTTETMDIIDQKKKHDLKATTTNEKKTERAGSTGLDQKWTSNTCR